ncbi:MAG: BMP family ABC transporter substrate-binding protein [Actinobacteria bacterium]|nr:BMP family ABC transporter substrate-binding protein [Actinomycetota bacterium]
MRSPAAVLLAVALTLGATCDDTGPTAAPSPTTTSGGSPRVVDEPDGRLVWGVVLPPPRTTDHVLIEDYRAAVAALLETDPEGIDEARVVAPESVTFRRDMLRFLAEEDTAYTCALGAGASEDVLPIARDHPDLAFCAVGDRVVEPPANVLTVDVRIEELAYLAGVAAAASAAEQPRPEGEVPTLGFVARQATPHTEGQRRAYTEGVRSVVEGARIVSEFVGNVSDADQRDVTAGLVANQYLGGAEAVYVASDIDASRAVEVAREAQRPIVGLAPALGQALATEDPPPVLFTGRVAVEPVLALVLERYVTGFTGGAATFGLADDVLEPVPGLPDLYAGVAASVEPVEGQMRAGELVIERS